MPRRTGFHPRSWTTGCLGSKERTRATRSPFACEAGDPGVLQVDVGDDGSADFSFERDDLASIALNARPGDDLVRIDESNGVFADTIPTTIDGGAGNDTLVGGSGTVVLRGGPGNDTLIGGSGAETLRGGTGTDLIDGNRGSDVAFMGAGDDTFVWDPGDGSDTSKARLAPTRCASTARALSRSTCRRTGSALGSSAT